jgi:hypothetical protein
MFWDLVLVLLLLSPIRLNVSLVLSFLFFGLSLKNIINLPHATSWSTTSDVRYRRSLHKKTKQCFLEEWKWEEILEGKGPWAQAGEYCRSKEEMEAAKAKRRRY